MRRAAHSLRTRATIGERGRQPSRAAGAASTRPSGYLYAALSLPQLEVFVGVGSDPKTWMRLL
jgi:hypothetical protein